MLQIGIPAIRILGTACLLSIFNMVIASALQGLSPGTKSMYLTMLRQAVLPLLFAFLFNRFGRLNFVWTAFVLAELPGIPFALMLWKKGKKVSLGSDDH